MWIISTNHPKIFCLCEHCWLNTYDEHLLSTAFPNYSYIAESTLDPESLFQPRIARGQGGVAILLDGQTHWQLLFDYLISPAGPLNWWELELDASLKM